jgi:hypothetical protein
LLAVRWNIDAWALAVSIASLVVSTGIGIWSTVISRRVGSIEKARRADEVEDQSSARLVWWAEQQKHQHSAISVRNDGQYDAKDIEVEVAFSRSPNYLRPDDVLYVNQLHEVPSKGIVQAITFPNQGGLGMFPAVVTYSWRDGRSDRQRDTWPISTYGKPT